ncbi:proteoglycan 3 [Erinaceus europaeus]|uniref:Proteoglycan 3 n=1 Tax=Erinaceus europaeus TaxID=9365 RepID=A0A1S2ZHX5_ERIEU|nr:proteoglycan 3 [Erinaceus europaeus]
MKCPLLLSLFLLGTISALHPGKDVPRQESLEPCASLSQDLPGSGEQQGELALPDEMTQSEGENSQDTLEDEEDMDSDPGEDLQCPGEEETVQLQGSPGAKTYRYVLVLRPRRFRGAQNVCRRCYRGNLVSIHNYSFNYRLQVLSSRVNQAQVWIGGVIRGWFLCKRFSWLDGSRWNFAYWASGQPRGGKGSCVALCTRGGHWRRARCKKRLSFICAY